MSGPSILSSWDSSGVSLITRPFEEEEKNRLDHQKMTMRPTPKLIGKRRTGKIAG
jgi:hypothetical protein